MPTVDHIVRREDVERIRRKLERYVGEYPALALLLDDLPEDLDELTLPDELDAPPDEEATGDVRNRQSLSVGRELRRFLGDDELVAGARLAANLAPVVLVAAGSPHSFNPYDVPVELERLLASGDVTRLASGARGPNRRKRVAAMEAAKSVAREGMSRAAALVADGSISPDEFVARLREELKDAHTQAAVAAKRGGWRAMTPRDWGRVGNRIRNQYGFADNFGAEIRRRIADGNPFTEGQIRARAHMYADAATASFSAQEAAEAGFDPASLGVMPGDGSTECYSRCRCRWVISVVSAERGDYNVRWATRSGESCKTCLARRRVWKRVRIRGGVLSEPLDPAGFRGGSAR